MAGEGVPKHWVDAFAKVLAERESRPPVVFETVRATADDLGLPPREIRRWIAEGSRVTASKREGSRCWTQVSIPYSWWYTSAKQFKARKNKERRERRAAAKAKAKAARS